MYSVMHCVFLVGTERAVHIESFIDKLKENNAHNNSFATSSLEQKENNVIYPCVLFNPALRRVLRTSPPPHLEASLVTRPRLCFIYSKIQHRLLSTC